MDRYSFLNNSDPSTIEELYKKYKKNPSDLDEGWASFFEGMDFAFQNYSPKNSELSSSDEFKVINLINDYRRRGHLFTKTNPVRKRREYKPSLSLSYFDLTEEDLDREFDAGHKLGIGRAKLRDIVSFLEQTYCRSIGVEFLFIRDLEMVTWLQHHFESQRNSPEYSNDEKLYILEKLRRSVFFESFLQKKFPGQKRFSLEGAESLIPALDAIMEKGSETGIKEFIIGMSHRGRLNVLVNILRKPYKDVFSEFEGVEYDNEGLLGDVKYHLGYTITRNSSNGKQIKFTLAPNPSHLEAVDPVVEGITRAKIDEIYDGDSSKIAPILIHGDASIAGQGVVYEVLQMQDLAGYSTGGTIHLVINNQIGFTTDYLDARSSTYCTDVAKTTLSPVFHVNGDDPESLVYSIQTAMEFRNKFKKDVFIDILCYRRFGHNEGDEPRFTQPTLYKTIEKHPNPYIIYKDQLIKEGITDTELCEQEESQLLEKLEKNYVKGKTAKKTTIDNFLSETWQDIRKAEESDFLKSPDTSIKKTTLKRLVKKLNELPLDKKFFRKSVRLHNQRLKMVEGVGKFDWAMGELLAYGSLVEAGIPVRFSGQDVERGTFSHRHAVLSIEDSEEKYTPLQHLSKNQASFEIYNSSLSEYGVLGFEYGYSLASPNKLTIWEAQFGDFANTAQVIFDQFISSAEDKWNVMNDLVVLLPHGYEGQGPEHSSARMERFLLLCADNNMQVANCSTPANFFHILRRQLYRPFRKPLIVFTPKSLLRHSRCISPSSDFTSGGFKEIIDDSTTKPELVKKVAICTGKIYYDLLEENEKIADGKVALVRIEQLYPFPMIQLKEILRRYNNVTSYNWVQEEPSNMGAWEYVFNKLTTEIKITVVARPASGSPSTGSPKFHNIRQKKIIDSVFGLCDCPYVNDECKMGCIGNKWESFEKELEEMKLDKMESTNHSGSKPLK
ncbi:MAG: 2-oxoglutarate dehydrogenase E1 component [Lentimicrobiaceae bacterium]|nr:2-oxoglutarate dehydrogenase E1 component [Lentimicrobiaceae bacterium]|tara:strand:+ start:1321 stop:4173 length:2853 start_codon:yes stop_codon:yes gene_type:complete